MKKRKFDLLKSSIDYQMHEILKELDEQGILETPVQSYAKKNSYKRGGAGLDDSYGVTINGSGGGFKDH